MSQNSLNKNSVFSQLEIIVDGYSFLIPDRLCKLDHLCYESKIMFKWLMVWYLQNHLEVSSLESITKKEIQKYVSRTQKLMLIIENKLPPGQFNLDALDKKMLSRLDYS